MIPGSAFTGNSLHTTSISTEKSQKDMSVFDFLTGPDIAIYRTASKHIQKTTPAKKLTQKELESAKANIQRIKLSSNQSSAFKAYKGLKTLHPELNDQYWHSLSAHAKSIEDNLNRSQSLCERRCELVPLSVFLGKTSSSNVGHSSLGSSISHNLHLKSLNGNRPLCYRISGAAQATMKRIFQEGRSVQVGKLMVSSWQEAHAENRRQMQEEFAKGGIVIVDDRPFKSFAAIEKFDQSGIYVDLDQQEVESKSNAQDLNKIDFKKTQAPKTLLSSREHESVREKNLLDLYDELLKIYHEGESLRLGDRLAGHKELCQFFILKLVQDSEVNNFPTPGDFFCKWLVNTLHLNRDFIWVHVLDRVPDKFGLTEILVHQDEEWEKKRHRIIKSIVQDIPYDCSCYIGAVRYSQDKKDQGWSGAFAAHGITANEGASIQEIADLNEINIFIYSARDITFEEEEYRRTHYSNVDYFVSENITSPKNSTTKKNIFIANINGLFAPVHLALKHR